MASFKPIRVIGVGLDGCASLSSHAYNAIIDCQVLVGGERQLSYFPDHPAKKIIIQDGLTHVIDQIKEMSAQYNVTVLASGDPLFFGIASLISRKIGSIFDIIPLCRWHLRLFGGLSVSCFLHGRPIRGFVAHPKHRQVAVPHEQRKFAQDRSATR